MTLRRNLTDPESRAFWASVQHVAEEVRQWPAWMRGESSRAQDKENRMQPGDMLTALAEV